MAALRDSVDTLIVIPNDRLLSSEWERLFLLNLAVWHSAQQSLQQIGRHMATTSSCGSSLAVQRSVLQAALIAGLLCS